MVEADSMNVSGVSSDIAAIEEAVVAQWSIFGHAPGGTWYDEGGLAWSEAPVPTLPYNAVLRTQLGSDADERIDYLFRHFQQRPVQFLWLVNPTSEPANLAEKLAARGLSLAEDVTGMSLDLTSWQTDPPLAQGPVEYMEVTDERGLCAFEDLMTAYWELPEQCLPYVHGISRWAHQEGIPGARWVAFLNNQPVGKVYLSLTGSTDTASIFGVYVRPQARGRGVAEALSRLAIDRAAELGRKRVVLHSSKMAVSVYRRLGFLDRCQLSVYATTSLHTIQPT